MRVFEDLPVSRAAKEEADVAGPYPRCEDFPSLSPASAKGWSGAALGAPDDPIQFILAYEGPADVIADHWLL